MPSGIRFALVYDPATTERVVAFDTLSGLSRAISRARRGGAIQLEDGKMLFQGETEKRDVVSIYAHDDSGSRAGFLGYAYADGRKWRAVRDAVFAVDPDMSPRVEAAA